MTATPTAHNPLIPPLEVYLLGLTDYDDLRRLQRRLLYDLGERSGAALILCEHPPTITVGRQGSRAHILPDDQALRAAGIRCHWVNRGGGCVLHLPGQLAVYLLLPLQKLNLNLADYLDQLHSAILKLLAQFDLQGEVRPDLPGVFLGQARVASVGIAVNRWIAYHGFTLNVGPYLRGFDLIEEPGIRAFSLRQTSLESRRQRPAPMSRVREAMIQQIEQAFKLERHHLFTDHPLIRRKKFENVYAPSFG